MLRSAARIASTPCARPPPAGRASSGEGAPSSTSVIAHSLGLARALRQLGEEAPLRRLPKDESEEERGGYPRSLWTKLSKTGRRIGAMRVKPGVSPICPKKRQCVYHVENITSFLVN